MCAPCCSMHQSLPRSLLFKSGPLRRSVVQNRRSRCEAHRAVSKCAVLSTSISCYMQYRLVLCRECRSDRVHTAASQQRSDHCLSRRALQAELVAAFAFAIPLRACSAEVESKSPAANADNELDLTVTEKVVYSCDQSLPCTASHPYQSAGFPGYWIVSRRSEEWQNSGGCLCHLY